MLSTLFPAAVETAVPTVSQIFMSEFLGTAVLLLLGGGVVATNLLPKSKGKDGGWLLINWGWGLAVFAGVYVAFRTGGHLNPAVTIAKVVAHVFDPSVTLAGNIPVTGVNVAVYIVAQFLGAFVGAVLCWLTFKKHFDEDCDPALKLGVFSTGPEIRSYGWNCLTEAIGTAVLILWIFVSGYTETHVGPLGVALIIVVIGNSLGGPTGYAINPARDLDPVSPTRSCQSRARAAPTGATPGSPSSARSSALSSAPFSTTSFSPESECAGEASAASPA